MIRRKAFPTPSSYLAKDEVLKVTAAQQQNPDLWLT
jgi:hypothetical protein